MLNLKKIFLFFTFFLYIIFCGANNSYAQVQVPGRLDPTFGVGGKVITEILGTSDCYDVAIQTDGKILCVGNASANVSGGSDLVVVRYNSDGTLDNSFDTDGKLFIDFSPKGESNVSFGRSIVIQSDGKIVVAGWSKIADVNNFATARLNSDGTFDTSFGDEGKVLTLLGNESVANSVAIQSDGKIVVAGIVIGDMGHAYSVVRYNSDGTLDTTFDYDGKVLTDVPGTQNYVFKVLISNEGKILVGGYLNRNGGIIRYNQNGSLDKSFDTDGILTFTVGNDNTIVYDLAFQTDGKIVFAGFGRTSANGIHKNAVGRIETDGTFDNSFGNNGKLIFSLGRTSGYLQAIYVQADGKILVAGHTQDFSRNQFTLARLNADGSFDTTFDVDGKVLTPFQSSGTAFAIALQSDGKIVLAGRRGRSGGFDVALARFYGECSVENSCFLANVSGRVLTQDGKPVRKVVIKATTSEGQVRYALTNPFGYYLFKDLYVGDLYTFTITSKRKIFLPVTVKLTSENLSNLNFISAD